MSWGVILVNLGSPAAPTAAAYRRFLKEFLSDPRVVEIPKPLWWPILNLFVLPLRPRKMAQTYGHIWIDGEGSPLAVITRRQTEALNQLLRQRMGEHAPLVSHAMTYGEPKLAQCIADLQSRGATRFFILPLYPQYSATTTAPVYDQCAALIRRSRNVPDIYINKQYCQRDDYIAALAHSVEQFRQQHGSAEKLLLSFHGIPQRCVELGDPYQKQCDLTASRLAERLQLGADDWAMSFQSRFGPSQWLRPYTVDVLTQWAEAGVKTVDVLCPAFAADCLETLEEIAIVARQTFIDAGGADLRLIPCLNDQAAHIAMLADIVQSAIHC